MEMIDYVKLRLAGYWRRPTFKLDEPVEDIERKLKKWRWLHYQDAKGNRLRISVSRVMYLEESNLYWLSDDGDNAYLLLVLMPIELVGLLDVGFFKSKERACLMSDADDEDGLPGEGGGQ